TLIRVENAYESFAKLLSLVTAAKGAKQGVHGKAHVEPSASIDSTAYVGPFAYVGE
ncbi:MAG TPA: UDP-3-O-(3-hydroxymyristoyl)glucosamine N-acyltransferase, partial [Bacteroidales bacterium]|nr:UDP-3-O-(3-hydroxymyristoyl)glucosamine N-acyltransferase [Bacteroidales bacterium]